jgi:hypothetical protein
MFAQSMTQNTTLFLPGNLDRKTYVSVICNAIAWREFDLRVERVAVGVSSVGMLAW